MASETGTEGSIDKGDLFQKFQIFHQKCYTTMCFKNYKYKDHDLYIYPSPQSNSIMVKIEQYDK